MVETAIAGPASGRMSRQRSKDTGPEMAIRRALHGRGLRYRVHARPLRHLRRHADLVFRSAKVAVFIDGCFWHGCPDHRTHPKRNGEFWANKIDGNIARDRDTDRRLNDAGWLAIRVWEHEDVALAALRIEAAVRERRPPKPPSSAR